MRTIVTTIGTLQRGLCLCLCGYKRRLRLGTLAELLRLGAQALVLLPELGSRHTAEVGRLEHGADFDFALCLMGIGAALEPLHRLVHRLDLPQPEAGDKLLRLGEGPIDHGPLTAGKADAFALRAWVKPFAR